MKSISVAINEASNTIEDVYEPYLIKQGLIMRTSRGRVAQEKAYQTPGQKKTKRSTGVILMIGKKKKYKLGDFNYKFTKKTYCTISRKREETILS